MPGKNRVNDYIAVIDIGSNAVRLVIYDGLNRAPFKIHSERVLCSLGADLAVTGKLHSAGAKEAFQAILRFSDLLKALKVKEIRAVATAAVRDAQDGPAFIAKIKKKTGLDIDVIEGGREADLSAFGVLMNGLCVNGLIGDYGGGSLELIGVIDGQIKHKASLPIGSHRLLTVKGREARIAAIDKVLESAAFLDHFKNMDFYALGGAWRSMAKAHMRLVDYPLFVIDHYAISGKKAHEFSDLLSRQSPASLEKTVGLSKGRIRDMAVAALAMERIFAKLKPSKLVFSATGLREGLVYEGLTRIQRKQDPLISSCTKISASISRFDDLRGAQILAKWLMPLFQDRDPMFQKLIRAASLLSDTGWFEHEDYQAAHAFERMLVLPYYGIDHTGRALLALCQYVRYKGYVRRGERVRTGDEITNTAQKILSPDDVQSALLLGLGLRLGYRLTGGALSLLSKSSLRLTPKQIILSLPEKHFRLSDTTAAKNALQDIAEHIGRQAVVEQ